MQQVSQQVSLISNFFTENLFSIEYINQKKYQKQMGNISIPQSQNLPIKTQIFKHYGRKSKQHKKQSHEQKKYEQKTSEQNIHDPLLTRLQDIFFSKYKGEQRKDIYNLLKIWKAKQIEDLQLQQAKKPCYMHYYKQIEILSARVYSKAQEYIKAIKNNSQKDSQVDKIRQFLLQKNIVFSYDRYFWQKKSQKKFNDEEKQKKMGTTVYLQQAIKLIKQYKVSKFYQLFKLMIQLELIIDPHQPKQIANNFALRISGYQQKKLYLNGIQLEYLQTIKNWNEKTKKQQKQKLIQQFLPNYYFYTTQSNNGINKLHQKQKDYRFLQERHDYIQLMFPNHYGSDFNYSAKALNYIEKLLFLVDQAVGLKVLISISIFFDFMGVKMNLINGKLQIICEKRLKNALIKNTHNHLRIMRILACLSVIGFRRIALKLIQFLDEVSKNIFLTIRNKFMNSWLIYGNKQDNTPLQKAKKMCFLQNEQFPQEHSILNRKIKEIQFSKQNKQSIENQQDNKQINQ